MPTNWRGLRRGVRYTRKDTQEYLGRFSKATEVDSDTLSLIFRQNSGRNVEHVVPKQTRFTTRVGIRLKNLIPNHVYVSLRTGEVYGAFVALFENKKDALFHKDGRNFVHYNLEHEPFQDVTPVNVPNATRKRQRNTHTNTDDISCPICTEVCKDPHILGCRHSFCKSCIETWRRQKDTCPICRTKITRMIPNTALQAKIQMASS